MSFTRTIYICYTARDTIRYASLGKKWVEMFEKSLRDALGMFFNERPEIYMQNLQDNQPKETPDSADTDGKAIFLLILNYSAFNNEQVESYFAKQCNDFLDKNPSAYTFFTVYTQPPENKKHTAIFERFHAYAFYAYNENSGQVEQLHPSGSADTGKWFWQQMLTLSGDIAAFLKSRDNAGKPMAVNPDKGVVYLSETSRQLERHNIWLKRLLQDAGIRVVPDKPLPDEPEDQKAFIRQWIQEADFSIHLIGDTYGSKPHNAGKSTEQFEYEIAALESNRRALKRLVWVPFRDTTYDPRQLQFLRQLMNTGDQVKAAEFFYGDLADVLYALDSAIFERQQSGTGVKVFLSQTISNLLPLREKVKNYLEKWGMHVLDPYPLPENYREMIGALDYVATEADYAVHLLGSAYGVIPEHSSKSITEIQLKYMLAENKTMQHLVWIDDDGNEEPRQENFAKVVRRTASITPGMYLIHSQKDVLPGNIHAKIRYAESMNGRERQDVYKENDPLTEMVFLDYHQYDQTDAKGAKALLENKNLRVRALSKYSATELLLEKRLYFMQNAGIIIWVFNKAPEKWLQAVLREHRRLRASGKNRKLPRCFLFTRQKIPSALKNEMPADTMLIHYTSAIDNKLLQPVWDLL